MSLHGFPFSLVSSISTFSSSRSQTYSHAFSFLPYYFFLRRSFCLAIFVPNTEYCRFSCQYLGLILIQLLCYLCHAPFLSSSSAPPPPRPFVSLILTRKGASLVRLRIRYPSSFFSELFALPALGLSSALSLCSSTRSPCLAAPLLAQDSLCRCFAVLLE